MGAPPTLAALGKLQKYDICIRNLIYRLIVTIVNVTVVGVSVGAVSGEGSPPQARAKRVRPQAASPPQGPPEAKKIIPEKKLSLINWFYRSQIKRRRNIRNRQIPDHIESEVVRLSTSAHFK